MSIKETATICSPIKNLADLLNIPSSSCLTNRFKTSPLIQRYASPRQKILLCHDMKGGYLEDKHTQGCQINEPCYRFFRWHLIDMFIYFSHELVTIPPLVWIDSAHKNGVQILGTFITEFDNGKEICQQLLASDDNVDRAVDALALLMAWYSFDGYLLNIENPIEFEHIPRLLSFTSKLKLACSKIDPNSVILWYDSVTVNGDLKWQNQLNELNQPFFNVSDGIFLNYGWKSESLIESKINAGERYRDVFVGIDVFGRGCFGGGGFNTCEALSMSSKNDLSTAIFAPGWLFETLDLETFLDNDRKFWSLLEPYIDQRIVPLKSLTTFFSDGFGKEFFIHGLKFSTNFWYNLSLQSYFPNILNENKWLINHNDAYFGGSCIEFEGDMKGYIKLFKCLIPIESICDITLVLKNIEDIILELKFDNGTVSCLEKSEEDLIIRNWTRKTYRITVNERVSITDISIHYTKKTDLNIKLGYLSIRPIETYRPKLESFPPLIQSIEQGSNCSSILHFVDSIHEQDSSSIILIFTRNQFEEYSFVGATYQSYFVIFKSDKLNEKFDRSILVIRHYSLESLDLINEQIISLPIPLNCLQEICCLAYDKKFDEIKAKIETDPDCIKKKDRDGRTVLHWACSSGATDIVQYLLDVCHIRPDIPDELGWTPLIIAVSTGHLDIVRMLLQTNKVDIEQSNSSGARPLHYACSKNFYEIAELLLEHDADINATDKYKQTPLDRCCSKGNIQLVELLLKNPKIDLSMHKECDGDHSLFKK